MAPKKTTPARNKAQNKAQDKARPQDGDPDQLRKDAVSPDEITRRAVARNPNTPVDVLTALLQDEDCWIAWNLAQNRSATAEILNEVVARGSFAGEVAGNTSAPVKLLGKLAKHKSAGVRAAVAKNRAATAATLKKLMADAAPAVRKNVARNTSTTAQILAELSKDTDDNVRKAVARNRNTPAALKQTLKQKLGLSAAATSSRKKTPPSLQNLLEQALSEKSKVRRRNEFKKALAKIEDTPRITRKLAELLLQGLDICDSRCAQKIATEYLPLASRSFAATIRKKVNYQGATNKLGNSVDAYLLSALVKMAPDNAQKVCDKAFKEGSDPVRAWAMQHLTAEHPAAAEIRALKLLSEKDTGPHLRTASLLALADSQQDRALELLIEAMSKRRFQVAAKTALEQLPHPRTAAAVLEELNNVVAGIDARGYSTAQQVRLIFLARLAIRLSPGDGLVYVAGLLNHKLKPLRNVASNSLANRPNKKQPPGAKAAAQLISALDCDDHDARAIAAEMLGAAGAAARKAAPALLQMLPTEPDGNVRCEIIWALSCAGHPAKEIVAALKKALAREPFEFVQERAVAAFGNIGAPAKSALPAILGILQQDNNRAAEAAPEAVADILPFKQAFAHLVAMLEHRNYAVRANAARRLGRAGAKARKAVPQLTALLSDQEGYVRRMAAIALGEMGRHAKDAVPALCVLLHPSTAGGYTAAHHNSTRDEVVKALAKTGPAAVDAIPALQTLRKEQAGPLRVEVDKALAAIGAGGSGQRGSS